MAGRRPRAVTRSGSARPSTASRTFWPRDVDGLGYGYGYAFAQDNGCELADHVVTLRGERSRFFGSDGEPGEGEVGGSNLASDAYYAGQLHAGTVRQPLSRDGP